MKNALAYASFIVTSILVILGFVTATTYTQLGVAVVVYPFIAFFAYKLFMIKSAKEPAVPFQPQNLPPQTESTATVTTQAAKGDISIKDIDKRAFLKLIGGTGISFFLLSLFNKRAGSLFLGDYAEPGISTITNTVGRKIDPSERQPLDGYVISEVDDSYIAYYGFTNSNGEWYIIKEDPAVGTFRYVKGDSDFSTHWSCRQKLDYDYFHRIFQQ